MKKLILISLILLVAAIAYPQATPIGEFRVLTATTAFGQNLPAGTKVYNVADSTYYVAKVGVVSTATLTTGAASFKLLNPSVTGNATHTGDVTGSTVLTIANDSVSDLMIDFGTGTNQVSTADVPEQTNLYYTDVRVAANSAVALNTAKVTNATHTGAITGSGQLTITDDSVTYAKMQNVASDSVLLGNISGAGSNVQELTATNVRAILNVADGANANLTGSTEKFEEDDGTPTAHSLAHTAVLSGGALVSLNGAVLEPALYTLTTSAVTMGVPVSQYDRVVITYKY